MAVDPRDFLLNTDYELDKIILVKTGDFVETVDIPHDFSFIPLPFGVWSTDSSFSSVNALGAFATSSDIAHTPPLGVVCTAYNDKITLDARGSGYDSTRIYYRLYAFEPSDTTNTIAPTSDLASKFILNTDYNYRKLKASGEFTQDGQEYQHNLGYIPQVMVWSKETWQGHDEVAPFADVLPEEFFTITTDKIRIDGLYSVTNEKIYWRLYYDEA